MRRWITRVSSILALGAASTLFVASCSAVETACPAVAYSSTVSVELIGDSSQVAEVIVCGGPECGDEDTFQESMSSERAAQARQGQDSWTATLFFPGELLTVVLIDSGGGVLLETHIVPDWVRTGGTERCGGPMRAEVEVELAGANAQIA